MKSIKKITVYVIIITLVLNSCSIEKKVYSSGYHIEWNKSKQNSFSKTTLVNEESKEIELTQNTNEKPIEFTQIANTIVSEDINNRIDKLSENSDSTFLNEKKDEVLSIKLYPTTQHSYNSIKRKNDEVSNLYVNIKNHLIEELNQSKNTQKNMPSGGKSQIVALVLCIFFGIIGIHRFYLGYSGMGVLYLFTLGLFGIGWIIDLILLIIPNGLTPKDKSSYRE